MIRPVTFNLPIGTMLIGRDGFSSQLAQICDVETTQFGQHYVAVKANGTMIPVSYVEEETGYTSKIGWFVATEADIARLS
jgi:hypothetical protein